MDNETPTSNVELIGLQSQLSGVRSELVSINSGLQQIAYLIQQESLQDQRRLLEERQEQQLLYERQISSAQETELEKKVSSSFVNPVNRLEKSINKQFFSIQNALGAFFGIGAALIATNYSTIVDKLRLVTTSIKDTLNNVFNTVSSVFSTIQKGFTTALTAITNTLNDIIKGINSLTKSPIKVIKDAFEKLKKFLGLGPKNNDGSSKDKDGGGSFRMPDHISVFGTNIPVPQAIQDTVNRISGQMQGVAGSIGNSEFGKDVKKVLDFFTHLGSQITNPRSYNLNNTPNLNTPGSSLVPLNMGNVPPIPPPIPGNQKSIKDYYMGGHYVIDTFRGKYERRYQLRDGAIVDAPDKRNVPSPAEINQYKNSLGLTSLKPLPETKTQVVMVSAPPSKETSNVAASSDGVLTDVPIFSTTNSENYYCLQSQTYYGVVAI